MQKYTYLDSSWDSIASYEVFRDERSEHVVLKEDTNTWESHIKSLGELHPKFDTPK